MRRVWTSQAGRLGHVIQVQLEGNHNMRMKTLLLALSIALAFTVSAAASPTNEPPPLGAILDLNGTPIPGGGNNTLQSYSVNFTAALTSTDITFAFREDPAFISFESASVVDLTNPAGNILVNGDFSGGVYNSNGNPNTPNGWEYANVFGASFGGQIISSGCPSGGTTNCWFDGAVQAYDAIDQVVATNIGDLYQISFNLADNNGFYTTFSRISTNGNTTGTGGNGIDALVYAQAGLPHLPEPASLLMMGVGLLGLGGIVRRRVGR